MFKDRFFLPTKIISGNGCVSENYSMLSALGRKAIVVTGKNSARINGSLTDIEAALKQNSIQYVIFDRVEANPDIKNIREASNTAREFGADFIIGCGGGSPLDAAKAAALLTNNLVDDENIFSFREWTNVLPVIAIPTTAGTGSEVTQYSVVTNRAKDTKQSISSELIFPRIAFLDARYTESLSAETTNNTAVDALSHAVEGYISKKSTHTSSIFALESMKILGVTLPAIASGKIDFSLREKLLYASMLGGAVIAQTGTTALHSMGYSLTYFKNIDHGRANGILMSEYLRYISLSAPAIVSDILKALGLSGIDSLERLIGALIRKNENHTVEEIKKYSSIAMKAANIANTPVPVSESDIENIFRKSL